MFRKRKRKRIILKLFLLLILAVVIDFYISNYTVGVTNIVISKTNIPSEFNGFKIVQISDLHDKDFGNNNELLVNKIKQQDPDIIVMTGDMIDGSSSDAKVFKNLCRQLCEIADVYYIAGNHEHGSRYRYKLKSLSQELGITYLNNDKVKLTKGKSSINLYGYNIAMGYYSSISYLNEQNSLSVNEITQKLGEVNSSKFNILLTHTPIYFSSYADWGADLTLCGHMHGGMIRIPFKGGVFSPHKGLFPDYDAGLYDKNERYMYVNKGLSGGSVGFRVYNQPEVTVITLKN
ncbi:metallophosphoesterase [Clostridium sp. 'deep sea']|uniref:metallophosphoesterase n=1 Tax=Clostridium sp. 'deep sea' TaxID=2779445 RepID=UPI00189665DD|nr:metallophosphoesterase [Clostridium sp. 'deep sea']QOR35093.1 metallophosphoesterase [Clostridium sp. 'deep sea']